MASSSEHCITNPTTLAACILFRIRERITRLDYFPAHVKYCASNVDILEKSPIELATGDMHKEEWSRKTKIRCLHNKIYCRTLQLPANRMRLRSTKHIQLQRGKQSRNSSHRRSSLHKYNTCRLTMKFLLL